MTTASTISAETQGLYKTFNPSQPTKVEYDGEILRVFGDGVGSFAHSQIDKVEPVHHPGHRDGHLAGIVASAASKMAC